ncbi:MAG: hypothetical protein BWY45_01305 [Euryarchaeota archaeon ADurb.Bin294]|jgi:hypothetical protein|nr:hypothetical protein [Methanospirillum sp.]OQA58077.1 MAG: hypothetical protein BWY45_01305 [Euryarchaeota archaeon ADurb.Bin294]
MDETTPRPVIISSEAFSRLKRLQSEFEEVIETIEILNTPDLMEQIQRSREDVLAGRIHSISSPDDLDRIWE